MVKKTEIGPGLTLLYYQVIPLRNGGWKIFGETKNETEQVMDSPFVHFTFTDANGNVYFGDYATPASHTSQPGEVVPFELEMYSDNVALTEGYSDIVVTACSWGSVDIVDEQAGIDLEVTKSNLRDDGTGYITGMIELTNHGTAPSYRPSVVFVFRNERGRVEWLDSAYPDGGVSPGTFTRMNAYVRAPEPNAEFELRTKEDAIRWVDC